ncbi:MAG: inositol monophosphatase [Bradyrhizobium sp.]
MTVIDPQACALLLRAATDQIASATIRPAPDQDIGSLIDWLRNTSAAAAAVMRSALAERYPGIGWVDEEGRPEASDEPCWVYDPIDGAYHFVQGLPLWSGSLALVQDGRTAFAMVYDPTLRELFAAQEGAGATLNGRTLTSHPKSRLNTAVLGTAVAPFTQARAPQHERALALLDAISRKVFVVRQMASASLQLAYVAAGRLDGYWETGQDLSDWLAGALLVRAAGGDVTDLNGDALNWNADGILAASKPLHAALLLAAAGAARQPLAMG